MRLLHLIFIVALIAIMSISLTNADDELADGECMSLDCDAKEYKPICGGLDVESSTGFLNECALRIYNCQHQTEWVIQTEVECDVAFSESSSK